MHIRNYRIPPQNQRQVLRDKRQRPFNHLVFGHPAGAILRHAEMSAEDGQIDILQRMRIVIAYF